MSRGGTVQTEALVRFDEHGLARLERESERHERRRLLRARPVIVIACCRESSRTPRCAHRPGRDEHALLDHLVRPLEQRLRNRQAERFRGLE